MNVIHAENIIIDANLQKTKFTKLKLMKLQPKKQYL